MGAGMQGRISGLSQGVKICSQIFPSLGIAPSGKRNSWQRKQHFLPGFPVAFHTDKDVPLC